MKLGNVINKLAGLGLLFASVLFFAQGRGSMGPPGLLFGIAGLVLLLRRDGGDDERAAPPSQLLTRIERLEDAVATSHVELGMAQKQIEQLLEERDFMRQLLARSAAPEQLVHRQE